MLAMRYGWGPPKAKMREQIHQVNGCVIFSCIFSLLFISFCFSKPFLWPPWWQHTTEKQQPCINLLLQPKMLPPDVIFFVLQILPFVIKNSAFETNQEIKKTSFSQNITSQNNVREKRIKTMLKKNVMMSQPSFWFRSTDLHLSLTGLLQYE